MVANTHPPPDPHSVSLVKRYRQENANVTFSPLFPSSVPESRHRAFSCRPRRTLAHSVPLRHRQTHLFLLVQSRGTEFSAAVQGGHLPRQLVWIVFAAVHFICSQKKLFPKFFETSFFSFEFFSENNYTNCLMSPIETL